MERKDLLDQIQTSRARLESALSKFRLDQMDEHILPDGWSVKDLFTHLGWWEFRVVDIYGTLTKGATRRIVIDAENVDRVNKRVIDEYKSHPLEEMRMYERQAYNSLLKIVETAPEQNLFNRHQFLWTQGDPLVNWIIRNTYEHYDDHAVVLEHCLANLEGLASATGATGGFGPVLLKAREFIQQNGRDIEKVQFDFHFDHAPIDDLMEVLGRYQNEDGGFYGLVARLPARRSAP